MCANRRRERKCPYCGSSLVGDAPDKRIWFNCNSCDGRFYLKDGELISPFSRRHYELQGNGGTCQNCGGSLKFGAYTAPWENGHNPDGYIKCPHCGYANFM